jgi:hypothetical protein
MASWCTRTVSSHRDVDSEFEPDCSAPAPTKTRLHVRATHDGFNVGDLVELWTESAVNAEETVER